MSKIKIPTNVEEARAMALLGVKWLQDNAPEQLTQHYRDIQAEAGRSGFIAGALVTYLDEPLSIIEADADKYAERVKDGKL